MHLYNIGSEVKIFFFTEHESEISACIKEFAAVLTILPFFEEVGRGRWRQDRAATVSLYKGIYLNEFFLLLLSSVALVVQ